MGTNMSLDKRTTAPTISPNPNSGYNPTLSLSPTSPPLPERNLSWQDLIRMVCDWACG